MKPFTGLTYLRFVTAFIMLKKLLDIQQHHGEVGVR